MKRYCLPTILVLSLALNVGVFATVGAHYAGNHFGGWAADDAAHGHEMLADYLELDERQRPQWRGKERPFMDALSAASAEIRDHREQMIREIFSERPDLAVIEAERAAISRLQEEQQRRVIEQLMAERAILRPEQSERLADLLLEQNPAGSMETFLTHQIHRP